MTNEPIYCKDCDSRNSWKRQPSGDVPFDSGKAFELCYECKVCHSKTLIPVNNGISTPDNSDKQALNA